MTDFSCHLLGINIRKQDGSMWQLSLDYGDESFGYLYSLCSLLSKAANRYMLPLYWTRMQMEMCLVYSQNCGSLEECTCKFAQITN